MSDKNNMAAEDYLDSLLRSIMGDDSATDSSKKTTEDENNDDLFGFGDELTSQGTEDDFLSDFEKEFFDEEESKMMASLMNEVKQVESEMKPAPVQDMAANLMSFDELDLDSFQFDEPVMEEPKVEQTPVQPTTATEPKAEVPQMEDQDLIFDGLEEFDDISDMSESMALVDEAVDKSDADVQDDLKGLYGILGVDGESDELPEDIEVPRKKKKKKKGFLERLFGGKKKNGKSGNTPLFEVVDDEEVDTSDDMSIDISALSSDSTSGSDDISLDGDMDLASAFDMLDDMPAGGSQTDNADEYTDFDDAFGFGLDDSAFDALGGGSNESENDMLIRQMDEGGSSSFFDEDDDDGDEPKGKSGKKGKKDKKDKKAKKDKKSKPKKAKKAKEQKAKKPKEPDEIIDVPFIFVIFLVSFVLVAVLGASMGGDYYNYQQKVYEAVKLYVDTDQTDIDAYESRYSEAYSLLSGLKMRDKDHKVFYNQVETIMFMDIHYESYKNYMLLDDYEHGLDSLIKAVKMYDKYQNAARELGCFDDMTVILGWVDDKLGSMYNITTSRAREIYMIDDDTEYATIVRGIAAEAEKNAANKPQEETGTEGADSTDNTK